MNFKITQDIMRYIVRCKNCMHYNAETKGCKRNPSVEAWEENDYCSYGEEVNNELPKM